MRHPYHEEGRMIVNTAQDLTSLRLRLNEAYDDLSNLPTAPAYRHKKFSALQSMTDAKRVLARLKDGITIIIGEASKTDRFVAYSLDKEEIATELNSDYNETHQLALDDARLTDEFCKEFAEGFGNCLAEASGHFHSDMYEMEMWHDFMEDMHKKIGATKKWFA
jgi:hypothetical protein